jgi:hypothetical protein
MNAPIVNSHRDEHGKFTKGNTFGRGRPRKEIERDYLAAIRDACSSEDVKEIFGKLVEQAKGGDLRAARYVLEACIGSREPLALTQIAIEEELGYDPVEEAVLRADTQQQLREAGSLPTNGNILKVTAEERTSSDEADEIPSPA